MNDWKPKEAWFVSVKEDGSIDREWGGNAEGGETPQERLMGAGVRIVKVAPVAELREHAEELDFNEVVRRVRDYLTKTYPAEQSMSGGWEITLTDEEGNPWIHADGRPQMPYEKGEFPAEVQFAVLRTTGALHLVIAGEVQDPAL